MACLPCAIEMEPKTLSPGQINHVKEQAEAIQKMEPEKALDIFIQGIEDVTMVANQGMEPIIGDDQVGNAGVGDIVIDRCATKLKEDMKNNDKMEKSQHCLCTSVLIDPPEEVSPEEPLTAPF